MPCMYFLTDLHNSNSSLSI
uniref:Uncharacterized protein n=1 Tax=Arundo donax TaxID=35708 RepID=A0A0A9BSG8_ARUDO